MHINLKMRTIGFFPHICSDFWTYSSPDSILLYVQSPGVCGLYRQTLVPLPPVIYSGQQTGKTSSHTGGTQRNQQWKTQYFFSFWFWIYIGRYLAIRLHQTSQLGKMCPTLGGEMGILVPKNNKFPFLIIVFFV